MCTLEYGVRKGREGTSTYEERGKGIILPQEYRRKYAECCCCCSERQNSGKET